MENVAKVAVYTAQGTLYKKETQPIGQKTLYYVNTIVVLPRLLQSKPWIMFAATLQPLWPLRPKTNVTLLFYFLKLYNFGLNEIFVGSTSSELQHPWISKITTEPKKS